MATTTVLETFPKASVQRAQVEEERKLRLRASNILSSEINDSDDPNSWTLKTVIKLDE